MNRSLRVVLVGMLAVAMLLSIRVVTADAAQQSAAAVSTADAAPFLGLWTLEQVVVEFG